MTKGKVGIKWDKVVESVWKEIGGNKEEMMSIYDGGEYKAKVSDMVEIKEEREKVDEEEHLKVYGGLREGIGMKPYLHGPMDYAKI